MKTKYEFTAKNGTQFKFDSYMEFATWYFDAPRQVMQSIFDEATFRIMERKATSSAAARKRMQ
jgi:hypothetical protein